MRRRIPDVLNTASEKAFTTCASAVRNSDSRDAIEASLVEALRQPATTVAVLELSSLGGGGGLLDRLAASGFEVTGPAWK